MRRGRQAIGRGQEEEDKGHEGAKEQDERDKMQNRMIFKPERFLYISADEKSGGRQDGKGAE